jgi:hypothetical protein
MNSELPYPSVVSSGVSVSNHEHASGVSWGAVFAGAAAAAALSFILLILGVGLGLSSISPYSYSSTEMSTPTIAWIAFMQLAASGIGGYIAGRLRVKWAGVHSDEVHFRDSAHGLLAWAVATLVTVALLAGGAKAVLGGAIDAGTAVASASAPALATGAAAATRGAADDSSYYSDMILRSPEGQPVSEANRTEISKIVTTALATGSLPADDRTYLSQLIAKQAGLSQADAEKRVDDIYARARTAAEEAKAKAKQVAEAARKAAAKSALWMFVALLLGAFVASLCATIGGEQRDHDRVIVRTKIN